MTDSLLNYCKQFEGVAIHGKNIRISFYYKGVRCIEPLKGIPVTKSNIKFAHNKRITILHEIATNQFDYRSHFPDSKKAQLFSRSKVIPTVSEAIEEWLKLHKQNVREKQFKITTSRCYSHIIPYFGNQRICDISKTDLIKWRDLELTNSLSNKTINDVITPLRAIFADALADRLIDFNPMAHIKNLKRLKPDEPDPFTKTEIEIFRLTETTQINEKCGELFAMFTGTRVSEWMSLAWEDVDLNKRQIKIQRSVVSGKYASAKNDGSLRTVDLTDQAFVILSEQRARTQRSKPVLITLLKEDNRTQVEQKLRFVFVNSFSGAPFRGSDNINCDFMKPFLEKCKIRYRSANQARHTFASQLLTLGVPERWFVKQMGWSSIAMLEKHYGRWMDSEMPDMAMKVSKLLSNGSTGDPIKKAL